MKHDKGISRNETLILILAVIIAAMVMLPALGKAGNGNRKMMCMANQSILARAWTSYHEDYDGSLVGGSTYTNYHGTPFRWSERPLYNENDNPEEDPYPWDSEFTMEYRLNGIRAGELYPYVGQTEAYHCPADSTWLTQKKYPQYQVYRSYSFSGTMNGEDFITRTGWPGYISQYRTIYFPDDTTRTNVCAERFNQIVNPAEKFVILEEDVVNSTAHDPQAYNLGSFVIFSNSNYEAWWDIPAMFHDGGAMLGFADGHVGFHKWQDQTTLAMYNGTWYSTYQPGNPDLQWVRRGYFVAESVP